MWSRASPPFKKKILEGKAVEFRAVGCKQQKPRENSVSKRNLLAPVASSQDQVSSVLVPGVGPSLSCALHRVTRWLDTPRLSPAAKRGALHP